MSARTRYLWILSVSSLLGSTPALALDQAQLANVLKTIDERQTNNGDFKSLMYMEQKEPGKTDVVYEMVVYRRDLDDKLMFLFTNPKTERGKGYLRADKNFWSYDPSTGKWDRRTDRERIGGTNSTRSDFDESRLTLEYDPTYVGPGTLGQFKVEEILLNSKPGVDTAFAVVRIWVDMENMNVLKKQDFAVSGKLMRTSYIPKWAKIYSDSKKADVWFPKEMRIYDEIVKGSSTVVLTKDVDLKGLEENLFSKAWLEGKSR